MICLSGLIIQRKLCNYVSPSVFFVTLPLSTKSSKYPFTLSNGKTSTVRVLSVSTKGTIQTIQSELPLTTHNCQVTYPPIGPAINLTISFSPFSVTMLMLQQQYLHHWSMAVLVCLKRMLLPSLERKMQKFTTQITNLWSTLQQSETWWGVMPSWCATVVIM